MKYYALASCLILALSGCGGGGGGTTTDSNTYTGTFIDAAVDGLRYEGSLSSSGITQNGGKFNFKDGEVIKFSLGSIILGESKVTKDDTIVTPQKLVEYSLNKDVAQNDPKVLAIAQLLLSSDNDGNPDNNIVIDQELIQTISQKPTINLVESDIDSKVIATYLDKDEQEIVDENEAYKHLQTTQDDIKNSDEKDSEQDNNSDNDNNNNNSDNNTDNTTQDNTTTTSSKYRLLAWNDLGMHCMDGNDYSVFSILPPYNNLVAQLITIDKEPKHIKSGVTITYEATPSLTGKWNTSTSDKTNFWSYVDKLFGVNLADDQGLAGNFVQSKTPQTLKYDSAYNWWIAEGIPVSPKNDDGSYNMYPMVKVVAKDSSGNILASTTTVLPVSDEMDCKKCHSSTSGYSDTKPNKGWVLLSDLEKDYKYNILRLHDQKHPTAVSDHLSSLQNKGYNYDTNGLEATANSGTPILCASCHKSNALPGSGVDNIKPLTTALHSEHADAKDPQTGKSLNDITNRNSCYTCHPGATTQCLRGAMGKAKNPDGTSKMQCQSCHGNMSAVGNSNREGWLDEPNCQSCHQNGKRYESAVTNMFSGTLREALDPMFATQKNTPINGKSLYRYSSGHGDMQCSACHGSTHAIYPSLKAEDNAQSIATQGHSGTIGECSACHNPVPFTKDEGPHKMHTVGQTWVDKHGDIAEHGGTSSCSVCHGSDFRGSFLSKTMSSRTYKTEWGTKTFAQGTQIGCYDCHNGPNED